MSSCLCDITNVTRILRKFYVYFIEIYLIWSAILCTLSFRPFRLNRFLKNAIIPSLTVRKRKNRCIPCVYWAAAIFTVVSNYSNLFLPFAFFLDCSHFTFGYELVVCPEPTGLMKIICDLFPLIQRDKSLLLYPGEIHSF